MRKVNLVLLQVQECLTWCFVFLVFSVSYLLIPASQPLFAEGSVEFEEFEEFLVEAF